MKHSNHKPSLNLTISSFCYIIQIKTKIMIKLRDYQQECVNLINNLEKGSVLVSMATGLGKTVVFSSISRRGRALIISHREELVFQPLKYYDCECGVEKGELTSNGEEVVSASVQSLARRLGKFKPDDFDLIITDEAHHSAAPIYKKIYAYFKPRLHVGFTATPNRGDKVRLDDIFDSIIFQRDLKWGIEHNFLTDVRCLRLKVSYDLRKVKRHMGDFAVGELDKAVNTINANKEIADVYYKYANGQTLIFASSVSHAQNIANEIKGAVVVSQSTKDRSEIIKKFTERKINVIVNCMIFTEGTDIPLIETIIIARPTQNASLYTQMVGRGLRKYEGKQFLTLIDCVGVTDKLDVCTAPSLLGLDADSVPEYRRDKIQGMLTDMNSIIEDARDCPESWILNVSAVNLFAKEQNVDTFRINWTKKSDGKLVYQFNCGDRIGIDTVDELGKTRVLYYRFDEEFNDFKSEKSELMNLQDALSVAYYHFVNDYADEKSLWDLEAYYNRLNQPATEKQLSLIQKMISKSEWEHLTDNYQLSKGQAEQIISTIKLRSLKHSDLLRMHFKAVEEKQLKVQQSIAMSQLKIRKLINKSHKSFKFYAIKHSLDLIITNDWNVALDEITRLNALGENCRYKSFPTLSMAQEFLRK